MARENAAPRFSGAIGPVQVSAQYFPLTGAHEGLL